MQIPSCVSRPLQGPHSALTQMQAGDPLVTHPSPPSVHSMMLNGLSDAGSQSGGIAMPGSGDTLFKYLATSHMQLPGGRVFGPETSQSVPGAPVDRCEKDLRWVFGGPTNTFAGRHSPWSGLPAKFEGPPYGSLHGVMEGATGIAAGGALPPMNDPAASIQAHMQAFPAKQQAKQMDLERMRLEQQILWGQLGKQSAEGLLFSEQGQGFPHRPFGATGVRMEPPSVFGRGTVDRETSHRPAALLRPETAGVQTTLPLSMHLRAWTCCVGSEVLHASRQVTITRQRSADIHSDYPMGNPSLQGACSFLYQMLFGLHQTVVVSGMMPISNSLQQMILSWHLGSQIGSEALAGEPR
jgi:hypothetical protein